METNPVARPDVATEPHPRPSATPSPSGDSPLAGGDLLQQVLPQIREVAQKVGGFKRMAEIAEQLDRSGTGT